MYQNAVVEPTLCDSVIRGTKSPQDYLVEKQEAVCELDNQLSCKVES